MEPSNEQLLSTSAVSARNRPISGSSGPDTPFALVICSFVSAVSSPMRVDRLPLRMLATSTPVMMPVTFDAESEHVTGRVKLLHTVLVLYAQTLRGQPAGRKETRHGKQRSICCWHVPRAPMMALRRSTFSSDSCAKMDRQKAHNKKTKLFMPIFGESA
jgi:hypothetical protein